MVLTSLSHLNPTDNLNFFIRIISWQSENKIKANASANIHTS